MFDCSLAVSASKTEDGKIVDASTYIPIQVSERKHSKSNFSETAVAWRKDSTLRHGVLGKTYQSVCKHMTVAHHLAKTPTTHGGSNIYATNSSGALVNIGLGKSLRRVCSSFQLFLLSRLRSRGGNPGMDTAFMFRHIGYCFFCISIAICLNINLVLQGWKYH